MMISFQHSGRLYIAKNFYEFIIAANSWFEKVHLFNLFFHITFITVI